MEDKILMLSDYLNEIQLLESEITDSYLLKADTATSEDELFKNQKEYSSYKKMITADLNKIKSAMGIEDKIIIASSIKNKLANILSSLMPVENKQQVATAIHK